MTRVTDYQALSDACSRVIFQGGRTNGLPSAEVLKREISAGDLGWEQLPGGILLLRQREGFRILNFMMTDPEALTRWIPAQTTLLELPWRDREPSLSVLGETLQNWGWTPLLHRVRLTRKGSPPPELPDTAREVRIAQAADHPEVLRILNRCYPPLTSCLPSPEALEAEDVLLMPGATLHYRRQGNTTEMRHLAVLPEARGRGLARALIAAYLEREGNQLSRVWVGTDNVTALHLYESFGYRLDGWHSIVLYYPKA